MPITALPASVDLRPLFPVVHDQGSTSACTAYGTVDAFVYQRRKQKLKPDMPDPAHMFTYAYTRKREGTFGQDVGANILDAFQSVCNEGIVQNKNWPDGLQQLEMDPETWWKANYEPWAPHPVLDGLYIIDSDPVLVGKHHRGATYRSVRSTDVRASLANGFPVVFGFSVHGSFWNTGSNGIVPLPGPNSSDPIVGGHCMSVVGYRADGLFIARNSWGGSWADQGYCYLDPTWFENGDVAAWDLLTWHAAKG
jgi:C1A family cysteine protease